MAGLLSQESGSDSGWAASYKSEDLGGGSDDDLRDFLDGEEVTSAQKNDNSNEDGWGSMDLGELDLPGSSIGVETDEWDLDATPRAAPPSTPPLAEGTSESEVVAPLPPPKAEAGPVKALKKKKSTRKVSGGESAEVGDAKPVKKKVVKGAKKKKAAAVSPSLLGDTTNGVETAPPEDISSVPPSNSIVESRGEQPPADPVDGNNNGDALSVHELRDLPAAPPPQTLPSTEWTQARASPSQYEVSSAVTHLPAGDVKPAATFDAAEAQEASALPLSLTSAIASGSNDDGLDPAAIDSSVALMASDKGIGHKMGEAAGEQQTEVAFPPATSTALPSISAPSEPSEMDGDSAVFVRGPAADGEAPSHEGMAEPSPVSGLSMLPGVGRDSSLVGMPSGSEELQPQVAIESQPSAHAQTVDEFSASVDGASWDDGGPSQTIVQAQPPIGALEGSEPLRNVEVPAQPAVVSTQPSCAPDGDDASAFFEEPARSGKIRAQQTVETLVPQVQPSESKNDVKAVDVVSTYGESEIHGSEAVGGGMQRETGDVAHAKPPEEEVESSAPTKTAYKIVKKNPFGGPAFGDDDGRSPFEATTSVLPQAASFGPPPPKPPTAPVAAPVSAGGFRIAKKNPFAESSSEGNDDFFGALGGESGPPAPQPSAHPPAAPTSWRPAPAATPFGVSAPADDGSNFFDEPPSPPPPAPSDIDQAGPPPPQAAWPPAQAHDSQSQQAGWQSQSWGQHQEYDAGLHYQQQQRNYVQQQEGLWGGTPQQSQQEQYSNQYGQPYGQQESGQQYGFQYGESYSYQGEQPESHYQYQYYQYSEYQPQAVPQYNQAGELNEQQQTAYGAYGEQWTGAGRDTASHAQESATYTSGAAPQPHFFVPEVAASDVTSYPSTTGKSYDPSYGGYGTTPQPEAMPNSQSQYAPQSSQPMGQQPHTMAPFASVDDGTSFFKEYQGQGAAAAEVHGVADVAPSRPPLTSPPAAMVAAAAGASQSAEDFFDHLGGDEGPAEPAPVSSSNSTVEYAQQSADRAPISSRQQMLQETEQREVMEPLGAAQPAVDSHGFQQFGQPTSNSQSAVDATAPQHQEQEQQQQPRLQQPYQFQSFGSDQLQSFNYPTVAADVYQQQQPGQQQYVYQYGGEAMSGISNGSYGTHSAYDGDRVSPMEQPQHYNSFAEQQYANYGSPPGEGHGIWDGQQTAGVPKMMVPNGAMSSAGLPTTAAEAMQSPHGRPACVLVAFAFGGRLVTTTPQVSWGGSSANWWDIRYGAGQLRVGTLRERLIPTSGHEPGPHSADAEQKDPLAVALGGPLGKQSKDKILKFCQERATAAQQAGQVAAGDAATLWQLLGVMVANKGSLRSGGKTTSIGVANSVEQQISRLLLPESQPQTLGANPLLLSQTTGNEEGAAGDVQQRLLGGDMVGALQAAVDGRLWGLALFIGHRLGHEALADVGAKMVACTLSPGSPLHSAALLLAGKPDLVFAENGIRGSMDSVQSGGLMQPMNPGHAAVGLESTWRQHLAILAACRTGGENAAIKQLGDQLLTRGATMSCAAHLCFLLAEEMPRANAEGTRVCLLGSDHIHTPRTYAHDVAAVQRTEVLEWCMAQASGQAGFCMLPLQPYKLLLASDLIEAGHVQAGLHYVEAVADTLQRLGKVPAGLLVCRSHASSMLEHLKVFFRQHQMDVPTGGSSILGKMDRWINRLMGSEEEDQKVSKVEPGGSPLRRVSSGQQLRSNGPPPPAAQPQAPRRASAPNSTGQPGPPPPSAPDSGGGKKAASQGSDMKRQDSGLMSLVTRVGSITSIFSSGGSGGGKNKAKMGESNKFYYDENLKMWREEGVDAIPDLSPPPPPPTSFPTQQPPAPSPLASDTAPSVDTPGGASGAGSAAPTSLPLGPPPANMFSKKKTGVGSRYVDTFGGGAAAGPARSSSPKPPLAPASARNSFFIPQAPISGSAAPAKTNFFVPSAPSSTGSGASQSDALSPSDPLAKDGSSQPPAQSAAPAFFTPPAPSTTGASPSGDPTEQPHSAHQRLPSSGGSFDMGGDLYTTYSDADLTARDVAPPSSAAEAPLPPPPALSPFGGPQPGDWVEPPVAAAHSGPPNHHSTTSVEAHTGAAASGEEVANPPPPPPDAAFGDQAAEDEMQDLDF